MKKLLLVSLVLLTGCFDTEYELFPEYSVPEELQIYVDEFEQQAIAHGRTDLKIRNRLEIRYKKDLGKMGSCNRDGRQVEIVLDEDWCKYRLKYHPDRLYLLIFHEMGHGFLKRGHSTNVHSIMYPTIGEATDWRPLVDELFE